MADTETLWELARPRMEALPYVKNPRTFRTVLCVLCEGREGWDACVQCGGNVLWVEVTDG